MLDNLNSKQKKILLIIIIVVVIGVIIYIFNNNKKDNSDLTEDILVASNSTNNTIENITDEKNMIVVHITGAIKTPGIVKLEEGSRIEDAINKAGGLTEDADISKVNLAYILEDGIKIKIPSSTDIGDSQDENILSSDSGEGIVEENKESSQSSSLNINKATEKDFQNLPGIGPSLASKIIAYRDENGKFSNIEEIKNVNGIGNSKYENIKEYIYIK